MSLSIAVLLYYQTDFDPKPYTHQTAQQSLYAALLGTTCTSNLALLRLAYLCVFLYRAHHVDLLNNCWNAAYPTFTCLNDATSVGVQKYTDTQPATDV